MSLRLPLWLLVGSFACSGGGHDAEDAGTESGDAGGAVAQVGGCGVEVFCPDIGDPFADCVETFSSVEGTSFNHHRVHEVAVAPPRGPLDTVSLGCGGSITMWFDDPAPHDGPGPDFIVFENPFSEDFPEAGAVSVSADGERWVAFECDPVTLVGCAGASLVHAFPGSGVEPTDPMSAGGDAFDLGDVGLKEARFVRIRDVSAPFWADRDGDYCDPGQGGKGGFDLDAIAVVD